MDIDLFIKSNENKSKRIFVDELVFIRFFEGCIIVVFCCCFFMVVFLGICSVLMFMKNKMLFKS